MVHGCIMALLAWISNYLNLLTGGDVFSSVGVFVCLYVCLSACLCVRNITQKVMNGLH